MDKQLRSLRSSFALLFSLLALGLGQLYNGEHRKAVAFVLAYLVVMDLAFFCLPHTFSGLLAVACLAVVVSLLIHLDAYLSARRRGLAPRRPYNRWFIYLVAAIAIPVLIGLSARLTTPFRAFQMPSGSMLPTIHPGDRFMATTQNCQEGELLQGDLVVFPFPPDPSQTYLKRVVGFPGDEIAVCDGTLVLDGQTIDESYAADADSVQRSRFDDFGPIVVPSGKIFVLGDNRNSSVDSRTFGPIDIESVKARVLYVYMSTKVERIGHELSLH